MTKLKLKPSPRLWVSEDTVRNLKDKLHSPWMQDHARRILANADWLVRARPIAEGEAPVYMAGTRPIGTHFQTLTAAWVLTHDPKYRKAAIRHLGNIMNWNQISCEAGRNTPAGAVLPFCLTYGEHCAHIAEMYDFFRPDITAEEQKVFFDVLDRFYLSAALRCIDDPPWWANTTWSNWNGVCCGGMGTMDLLSFKCMVNGERMITDQHGGTCVSFTRRGHHIFDRSAASKSTLFVDGLACMENAVCDTTEVVKARELLGLRIDGSHIYLVAWKDLFIGRLFLLVENRYWLVIDRMVDPNIGSRHSIESRFHTFAEVRTGKRRASLKSGRERLTMSFAALSGGTMQEALGMPSLPGEQTRIIRWMSATPGNDLFHVTALNPGRTRLGLKISRENRGGLAIEVSGAGDTSRTIRVSSILKLRR